jgi:hypothetical protein
MKARLWDQGGRRSNLPASTGTERKKNEDPGTPEAGGFVFCLAWLAHYVERCSTPEPEASLTNDHQQRFERGHQPVLVFDQHRGDLDEPHPSMNEPYHLFVLALFTATILVTIVCASIGRSTLQPKQRRLAQLCRALGVAVAIVEFVGTVAGLIIALSAATTTVLRESDRALVLNNGLVGAGYNFLLSFVIALPALLVARRSLRQP